MGRCVIIVAGGSGVRMGNDMPKQFLRVGGEPVLMHTLRVFAKWDSQAKLIVVLPAKHINYWRDLCTELRCAIPHEVVTGGETRYESVRCGLSLIGESELVGIHDGVRPLVSTTVIKSCFESAAEYGSGVPVVPLTESLRRRGQDGSSYGVDRSEYCIVQTPQVFRREWLLAAYAGNGTDTMFTDDATLVESLGYAIRTVPGNVENIKLTHPYELHYISEIIHSLS